MAKLTGFNILLVLFVAAGGFTYGFAFSVFVSSVGQPGFYKYFGLKCKISQRAPYGKIGKLTKNSRDASYGKHPRCYQCLILLWCWFWSSWSNLLRRLDWSEKVYIRSSFTGFDRKCFSHWISKHSNDNCLPVHSRSRSRHASHVGPYLHQRGIACS